MLVQSGVKRTGHLEAHGKQQMSLMWMVLISHI